MFSHVRGRCWWHGKIGWTFPPIFHYILLLYDRWQQRGSLTKWCLTWKCIWRKDMWLNPSLWKPLHSLRFIDAYSIFMKTKLQMWAQWGGEWCWVTSAGVDFYDQGMQVLVHWRWKCRANADMLNNNCFVGENLLYQTVLLCFVSVLVSMEINRGIIFRATCVVCWSWHLSGYVLYLISSVCVILLRNSI